VGGLLAGGAAHAGAAVGKTAPTFTLPTLSGKTLSLSSLRGQVVLLDFWAEWCDPCKRELPELERLAREWASRGVVVVGVNLDKQRDQARRLAESLGLTFDQALDPAGRIADAYDLPKMPTSYVLDREGVVRFIHEGFDGAADVARFREELNRLAPAPAPAPAALPKAPAPAASPAPPS
jgi:peroxiredoxin